MKKTYVTSMPDHIGAFLKASKCFSELNINITRVSYNKAVDSHMLFIDGEGTEQQLSKVAPNKMFFKGIYENRNGHLPTASNRIWYEADINYESGFRGTERILFSNDGLIFVTYDHYYTFIEIE